VTSEMPVSCDGQAPLLQRPLFTPHLFRRRRTLALADDFFTILAYADGLAS
jgi:hypothetical protein